MTIRNGLIAGFVATVVLSVLFVMKAMMGVMPQMDVIAMLAGMMGMGAAMGWVGHFAIGTVAWGGLFAIANDAIPGGSQIGKGLVFGIAAWLAMMLLVMPMAGAGLFGASFGMMGAVMPLVLHIIFGVVLGGTYGALASTEAPA